MRSGERCTSCEAGRMKTYCTRTVGSSRIRFLKCSSCDAKGQEACKVDELGRTILDCTLRSTAVSHNAGDRL